MRIKSMKKRDDRRDIAKALAMFTQLGFTMAACVAICVFIGGFLDRRLGTGPWLLLLGSVVGALSAFKVLYDLAIKEWFK